jgi:tRNA (pseudouridine54-N1)-methyltransferase
MTIIFFIKSKTVNISNYNIKNIPGSSGRLDVISRCILAALLKSNSFEKNIQIWVFLDQYGTFIFSPDKFAYDDFPKNEIFLTDYYVRLLQKYSNDAPNPLKRLKISKKGIITAIKHFQKLNYSIYILQEYGEDFFKLLSSIKEQENIVFILGSQEDDFLNSEELLALNIPFLSFGNQSYLASSVIRLLKLYILGS